MDEETPKEKEKDERQTRLEELSSLTDTKHRLLEQLKDDVKLQIEKLKSLLKNQIILEEEIQTIEYKVDKLREEQIGGEMSEGKIIKRV